jgi:hypothetical protein
MTIASKFLVPSRGCVLVLSEMEFQATHTESSSNTHLKGPMPIYSISVRLVLAMQQWTECLWCGRVVWWLLADDSVLWVLIAPCEVYNLGNIFIFVIPVRSASNYCGNSQSMYEKSLTTFRNISKKFIYVFAYCRNFVKSAYNLYY